MALTVGTVAPFAPSSGVGGGTRSSGQIMSFPYTSSSAIRVGDVVVLTSGLAVTGGDAGGITDGTILGIALEAKASAAGMLYKDQVLVSLATPGATFTGNLVGGAATDQTTVTAAIIVSNTGANTAQYDTIVGSDSYALFQLINVADTTGGICRTLRYTPTQKNITTGGITPMVFSSASIVNPRVEFAFRGTIFQPVA